MKNKTIAISLTSVLAAVMLILLFISAFSAANVKADEAGADTSDTVTVSGSCTVYATPDKAELHFGVRSTKNTAADAQEQNTKDVTAVIDKLKELGVDEKNIVTSAYNIYQEYDYEKDKPAGYTASTSLTIKDVDVDDAGDIITRSVEAGVNEVQNITYTCSEYDAKYEDALKDAVAAAKKKAEVLAKAAGKEVGSVQIITEGYQDTSARFISKSMSIASEEAVAYDTGAAVPLMPGDSEITANVTVTWYLK